MTHDDFAFAVRLDLDAIRSRYRQAIDSATPGRMSVALLASASDVLPLASEVERLSALVLDTRLAHANLRAAVRAALSAARDGEPDPFAYLADELHGEWPAPRDDRGQR